MSNKNRNKAMANVEVSNRILTAANVISCIRLCLIPVVVYLLYLGLELQSTITFAVAAATDFLDGQVARRTNTVTKLGQILDPLIDRLLLVTGVFMLFFMDRIPLWILVLIIARDLFIVIAYALLLKKFMVQVQVIFLGKVATTFMFVGFAFLLLGLPVIPSLGLVNFSWLPGFGEDPAYFGIWFVYTGLVLGIISSVYYAQEALRQIQKKRLSNTPGEVK